MTVAVAIALPFVVPPAVEHLLARRMADCGLRPDVHMCLYYCWRNGPGIAGTLRIAIGESPWCLRTRFGASCCEWSADATMDKTTFSHDDPAVAALLKRFPAPGVSNLVFSGSLSLDAHVERTFSKPLPFWRIKLPIKDLSAGAMLEDRAYSVTGLSFTAGASGIADHVDFSPLFLRATALDVPGVAFTNLTATIRASERALMISEASAGFCGGKVSLYSVFLNPKNLNAGFTLFAEDIDAGQALAKIKSFRGNATGRLHGKLKLFVREGGRAIRLSDAFLYSKPGEIGKLQMKNPDIVADNLALAGIDAQTRANVANALTDLDYTALRLNLTRCGDNDATLTSLVSGTATRGAKTVPVNLTVNFHGELDQLLNTSLGLSAKMKGNSQ